MTGGFFSSQHCIISCVQEKILTLMLCDAGKVQQSDLIPSLVYLSSIMRGSHAAINSKTIICLCLSKSSLGGSNKISNIRADGKQTLSVVKTTDSPSVIIFTTLCWILNYVGYVELNVSKLMRQTFTKAKIYEMEK